MSNSNDNKEISSNVSCNPGPSSCVESSINNNATNLENITAIKASTSSSINKVVAIEKPCANQCNVVINQANTVSIREETNPSTDQDAGASSSNPFNSGTSEIIESTINYSTADRKDENNKNIVTPQLMQVFNNHANVVITCNISEASVNLTPNTINRTELPFQASHASNLNTDRGLSEEHIRQVIQTENVIITQASINDNHSNLLESGINTVNNITNGAATTSAARTLVNNTTAVEQVSRNKYLTNKPTGLPYPSATQTDHRSTERRRKPERVPIHHAIATLPLQLHSPRSSRRDLTTSTGNNVISALLPNRRVREFTGHAESNIEVNITPPPVPPLIIQGPPPLAGAPPTYSAVMRLGPEDSCNIWTHSIRIQPSPPFIAPIPPPPYTEVQGMHTERPMLVASADQMIWGPDPISVVCPRCATVVVTSTQSQRSNLTHFSALALCLCGCWPCCLLPYCMESCKNTYHHCPTCQQFLGMYRPW